MKSLYTLTIVLLMAQYVLSNDDIVLGLTFTVSEKKASEYAEVIKDNVHARAAAVGNTPREKGDGSKPSKIMLETGHSTTHPSNYLILNAALYSSNDDKVIQEYQTHREEKEKKPGAYKKKIDFLENKLTPIYFYFFLNIHSNGANDSFAARLTKEEKEKENINECCINNQKLESQLFKFAKKATNNKRNPLNIETETNITFRFFPYDNILDKGDIATGKKLILFTTPESLRNSIPLTE